VGTPDAGAFWRVISEHKAAIAVHRADGVPRDQEGRPEGDPYLKLRPVAFPDAVPGRRTGRPGHHRVGAGTAQGAGDRPLVADRNRLDHCRQPGGPWATACQAWFANRSHAGLRCAGAGRCGHPVAAGDTLGNIVVKLPLPPGCLPTLWNADERFKSSLSAEFPGYYKTADAGYIDEDGYLSSWRAPMTSSMWPATGCRPAAWRRCWRPSRRGRMRGDRYCRQAEGANP
jgi:propionyl-CoA synthetase